MSTHRPNTEGFKSTADDRTRDDQPSTTKLVEGRHQAMDVEVEFLEDAEGRWTEIFKLLEDEI
jgi:hypothetical protein